MEKNYPILRRPKRKLCFLANNERPSKQWAEVQSLGDIDKMFDDLDPSSHDDNEPLPPSSLLHISDAETNQSERETPPLPQQGHGVEELPRCQMSPKGDDLHPAMRSPSPELDLDLDLPFKAHGPVKTSSPIEGNKVVEGVEKLADEKERVMLPILFPCEDDGKVKARTEPLTGQKYNGSEDSELESPPSTVVLIRPKSQKNKVDESCGESHLVQRKTPRKLQTADLEHKVIAPRPKNTDPPVLAVTLKPEVTTPVKKPGNVHRQLSEEVSSCVKKDMSAFLQKLREAAQPKPSCSRKSQSPVKIPNPEPEDDFMILEDDRTLWISIPTKIPTSKRPNRTSSTDKDTSTDKGAKGSPPEIAQKQQESEQANRKLESEIANQKTKKMKEKKTEVTEPRNEMDELRGPEDLPLDDLMEQEKRNEKKQRLKKVPSKESDKEEGQSQNAASGATKKNMMKMEKKNQKSNEKKTSKPLKDGNERAKSSKSSKGVRKVTQGSGRVKETVYVESVKEQSQERRGEEHADAEVPALFSDEEIKKTETQINEKDKLPVVSEDSSSGNDQIIGRRKRRPPGQWWLNSTQGTGDVKVTDTQPTPKKSKQNNKQTPAPEPSPAKPKKDRGLKRRNQSQPLPLPSQTTNTAKEKRTKQNKNISKRGNIPGKLKVIDKECDVNEAGQIEQQQQECLDQDPDPLGSSPLDLAHRDHSLNSGNPVFQRVYHCVSDEKMSVIPASPRGSRKKLGAEEPEKRRRKPTSNWWMVNGLSEEAASQPQQQKLKLRKERKQSKQVKSPGLKNGNMLVSSKPSGGAPATPLKVAPASAPKTVKRSLATFKDIFTSTAETPTVVSSKEAGGSYKHEVTARPAVEVTGFTTPSRAEADDILSMDAGASNNLPNHEVPQNSKCQSENMLKAHRSGPSSMIVLEDYEENDSILPSTRVDAVLSASDLCAPPLKPLILQPKDKANLMEWFKSLWSTTVDSGPEITPDQFDWYFYQGRAIGFQVDLNCGSICTGKILLGSYMKKPLWVDHSATTVFNLLTSSVRVIINGSESRFNPAQSFLVPCGHAYSIQNVTAQPAVLYFTRIFAENSD